jgi:hypothetical protein
MTIVDPVNKNTKILLIGGAAALGAYLLWRYMQTKQPGSVSAPPGQATSDQVVPPGIIPGYVVPVVEPTQPVLPVSAPTIIPGPGIVGNPAILPVEGETLLTAHSAALT